MTFGSEIRKLRRPLVLWCLVGFVAVAAMFSWNAQRKVADDAPRLQQIQAPPSGCADLNAAPGPECDQRRQEAALAYQSAVESARQQFDQAVAARDADERVAALLRHPVGAARMAGGLLASLPGALLLLVVAGAHVAGEWTGGTLRNVLVQEPRRVRVATAKLLSLAAVAGTAFAAAWAVTAALGPLLSRGYPLHVPDPSFGDAARFAGPSVGRAVVVVAAFAALATLAAWVARSPVATIAVGTGGLLVSFALPQFPVVTRGSLAYWVDSWMRFTEGDRVSDHVWNSTYAATPNALLGGAALCGVVALAAYLGVRVARTADVS